METIGVAHTRNCQQRDRRMEDRVYNIIRPFERIKRFPYEVSLFRKRYFLAIYMKLDIVLKECLKYNFNMAPTRAQPTK